MGISQGRKVNKTENIRGSFWKLLFFITLHLTLAIRKAILRHFYIVLPRREKRGKRDKKGVVFSLQMKKECTSIFLCAYKKYFAETIYLQRKIYVIRWVRNNTEKKNEREWKKKYRRRATQFKVKVKSISAEKGQSI